MNTFRRHSVLWITAVLMLVVAVNGCRHKSGGGADSTIPTVSYTIPLDAAASVATNIVVTAGFSEEMNAATLTTATFTLKQGTTPVSGTVALTGKTATFTPAANLAAGTLYTATITTGAGDLTGNGLASDYTWTFTTGASSDTSAPTVSFTVPLAAATGVALNSTINATFSEVMSAATIASETFSLQQGTTPVSGTVSYTGRTATFTPAGNLTAGAVYTATITTGARDLSGKPLAANYTWSFTAGTASDTTAPTVSSTSPVDGAANVPINSTVHVVFSEAMRASALNTSTFTLMQGTTAVPGTVSSAGTMATFTPAADLAVSAVHTATITTGAKDLAGNALAADKVWSFTTGTTTAAGPAPVVLGTAGNYVILAKAAISTTGATAVTGNIGLSPAAASYITGFSLIADPSNTFSTSSLVTGQIFAADYADPTPINLTTAVLDMMIAFTDAAGRAPDYTELGSGNIGGMTLAPGTYKWGTGVTIPSDVTLSGGPNDVWIFQIAQDLVMSSGASVKLLGGALPQNIFWQVSGIIDMGTASHLEGIALSQTAITLKTGASVNGRLLAQTAVTLDASTVAKP